MRFGVFYELQMPKSWDERSEQRVVHEALEQVALADRLLVPFDSNLGMPYLVDNHRPRTTVRAWRIYQ